MNTTIRKMADELADMAEARKSGGTLDADERTIVESIAAALETRGIAFRASQVRRVLGAAPSYRREMALDAVFAALEAAVSDDGLDADA